MSDLSATVQSPISGQGSNTPAVASAPDTSTNGTSPDTVKYTIKSGDTLWHIAQTQGITVEAIEAVNPGIDPNSLGVGQVINLPNESPSPPPDENLGKDKGGTYVPYRGPATNFPDWASWDDLWTQNQRLMKIHDSDKEINAIQVFTQRVSKESGVDARVILCVIMQESGGNVRVKTTNNGVRNPGIMQSHNGVEFDPNNPLGSIQQMIKDGTEGTKNGPGIQQLFKQYGNYYSALRAYNSGSVNPKDLNDPRGAVAEYVQSTANRLMGHTWPTM